MVVGSHPSFTDSGGSHPFLWLVRCCDASPVPSFITLVLLVLGFPLSGEVSLSGPWPVSSLESETGPESVVGNAFSDAVISSLQLSGSPRGSLHSRLSELQTCGWREGGSDPGGSGCRARSAAGSGGLGVGGLGPPYCWACSPGRRRPQRHAQVGPPDLRGAGAPPRITAPAHTPGPALSPPGWDGRQWDASTAVLPMPTPNQADASRAPLLYL